MPEALCSAIWKNAAEAGADRAARTATGAERRMSLRMLQGVAPVLLADEALRAPQRLEREHDLAPVAPREPRHQPFQGLRPVRQRSFHRVEGPAFQARRLRGR